MDLTDFNKRWLQAWTDKDVPRLVSFYTADTAYFDPQVPDGVYGEEQLTAYLTKLFQETPPMRYDAHELWATETGYCGRWYCTVGAEGGEQSLLRGFDLVELEGERIKLNEVYVHPVTKIPAK